MAVGPGLHALAWRNLWRHRRRTLLTVIGFAFGIMMAVLFTGLADSIYGKMIDLAARTGSGHVTVEHPEFRDTPSLKRTIRADTALRARIAAEEHVTATVPRIAGPTMLATAKSSYGAFFIAVDPAQETPETLSLVKDIDAGEMLQDADDPGVILGATLARNLGTELGNKVVYTLTDKSGEIVSGLSRVRGIVRTGSPSVDRGLCLLGLGTARKALGYADDEVTQLAVFVDDQRKSEQVAARVRADVEERQVVLTWRETQPDLAGYILADSSGLKIFEIIIMIVLAAGIFNSLLVSVLERLRELGIMMAIGFSPRQLFVLILWESLFVAILGGVLGALVTAGPYYYLNTVGFDYSAYLPQQIEVSGVAIDPIMYVAIHSSSLIVIAVVAMVATLLAGLYPAYRAATVAPVEVIKLV